MCRLDDECSWIVSGETNEVATEDLRCEDCGRMINMGENYVHFTAEIGDAYEGDEPRYIFVAQLEQHLKHYGIPTGREWTTLDNDKPWYKIDEMASEFWEYYGCEVFEEENPDCVEPDHISCMQCRLANKWLTVICRQHTVMVTCEDLNEHVHEYDPETLGEDFMMLVESVNRGWRRSMGISLLTPEWVSDHTQKAIDHAIARGLQEKVGA